MSEQEPPSGEQTTAPQADGTAAPEPKPGPSTPASAERHPYSVAVAWSGDGKGCGEIRTGSVGVTIPIGGAVDLGGCGKGANPEELLLAAIGACFVNTWAIFLRKLAITYAEPTLRVTGKLETDPAGGYRMKEATVHARVPDELLSQREEDLRKTLQLAERYCIISKAVRMAIPLKVEVEKV